MPKYDPLRDAIEHSASLPRRGWAGLTNEQREYALQLFDLYLSGELQKTTGQTWSKSQLYKLFVSRFGNPIGVSSFKTGLEQHAKQKAQSSSGCKTKRVAGSR